MATKPLVRTFVLLLTLALAVTGCAAPNSGASAEQARFNELLHREFVEQVTADSVTLHWFLRDPAGFGITEQETRLSEIDFPGDADIARLNQRIEEFRSIDKVLLTPAQQADYDVLAWDLGLLGRSLEYHYLDTGLLGVEQVHLLMPILLGEYAFDDAGAIDRYLVLLSQAGDLFDSLIRHQDSRAERGLYLTDKQLARVIDECQSFLSPERDNVLLVSFAERLTGVDLADEAAQSYLEQNQTIFTDTVVPAYERLIAGLERLRDAGQTSPAPVVSEESRAYYAYAVERMGLSKTPEEMIAIADQQVATLAAELAELMAELEAAGDEADDSSLFGNPMTGPELFDFFAERAADDFPALPDGITVAIDPIPDSLAGLFAPAYYLMPRLDDQGTHQIRYDAGDAAADPDRFGMTMAHEGVPGHLMQQTLLRVGSSSPYRQVIHIMAHTEGWAQYAETYAYRYTDAHDMAIRLHQLYAGLDMMMLARLDLGVHYEGWGVEEAGDFITSTLPDSADPSFIEGYFAFAEVSPLLIMPYAMGEFEVGLLRDRYQSRLGPDYTDRMFHEDFLNQGPAPFHLIERWMDEVLLGR